MVNGLGVVIPVRLESERMKQKALLPFGGKETLLEWKIEQVKQVMDPSLITVSTEADALKEIAFKCGVKVHHRDPIYATGNGCPLHEVIRGIMSGVEYEHIAWVTVVVPLMGPELYREAFEAYGYHVVAQGEYDSLLSMNLIKEYLWDDNGSLNYKADEGFVYSQNLPNVYRVTNGLYMQSRAGMIESGHFVGPNPYRHVVPKATGIDIDHYEDYEMAKALMAMEPAG